MASDESAIEIVICLGSSCFARGNSENLATLNQFAASRGGNVSLRMTGRLCQDECKEGPNVMVGGEIYHNVTPARLHELLQQIGKPSRGQHGAA